MDEFLKGLPAGVLLIAWGLRELIGFAKWGWAAWLEHKGKGEASEALKGNGEAMVGVREVLASIQESLRQLQADDETAWRELAERSDQRLERLAERALSELAQTREGREAALAMLEGYQATLKSLLSLSKTVVEEVREVGADE